MASGTAVFHPVVADGGCRQRTAGQRSNLGNMSFLVDIFSYLGISMTLRGGSDGHFRLHFAMKGGLNLTEGYLRTLTSNYSSKIRTRNIRGLCHSAIIFLSIQIAADPEYLQR